MKILYLAHRIPYPPNKGDKIRTFNEIKHLAAGNEIHLLALADNPDDMRFQADLRTYCEQVCIFALNTKLAKLKSLTALAGSGSLSAAYFYVPKLQKTLDQWLETHDYDAVICFSSPMAEYLFHAPALKTRFSPGMSQNPPARPVLIMDFCDLDSQKWRQYADQSRLALGMIYKTESRRLLAYEKLINQKFDHSVFVSQTEVDLFKQLYPDAANLTAIQNGVDTAYFSPAAAFPSVSLRDTKDQKVLVFTGAMDYYANVDGVTWFCRNIFPSVKETFPDALFYIVGSSPGPGVRDLARIPGVRITGFVDDIRPYYHGADVCVIPLRIAAGVQNKILEAMAMARPVVTTANAFKGIGGKPGSHALVEDTPPGFAHAVIRLLENDTHRLALARNAMHLSWTPSTGKPIWRNWKTWSAPTSNPRHPVRRQAACDNRKNHSLLTFRANILKI
jgi:polysaccharide biosynthesis protein PslH